MLFLWMLKTLFKYFKKISFSVFNGTPLKIQTNKKSAKCKKKKKINIHENANCSHKYWYCSQKCADFVKQGDFLMKSTLKSALQEFFSWWKSKTKFLDTKKTQKFLKNYFFSGLVKQTIDPICFIKMVWLISTNWCL